MKSLHLLGLASLGLVLPAFDTPLAADPAIAQGRAIFDKPFRRADGVGSPGMNANSCRACHQDPVMGGAAPLELNVSRFGRDFGGTGPFTDLPGGQAVSKIYPPHIPGREEYPVPPNLSIDYPIESPDFADCFEQRQPPSILGDGLIETIPGFVIVANEDPTDADGDGIFGVARRVTVNGFVEIGKFGWKAQIPTLRDFVNDAMINELGITTPDDGRGFSVTTDGDATPDPEISAAQVDKIAIFMSNLPAPVRGGSTDPQVALGEVLFDQIGCAKCHIPELLGSVGRVPLYSDLLLHNVMRPGYRGMAEPGAGVGFFRTPPLWGIGDTPPYMHDGRAEDLPGAILDHDGEAAAVRSSFAALSPNEQQALILFLKDL